MPQNFTDLMLRKLTSSGQDRVELWDARIPSFGVRVSSAGTKTFILMYRHRGRPRRLTLGRYPVLTLADARAKATEALLTINQGVDPALVEHAEDDPTFQFDAVAVSFVTRHCNVRNKASTAKETERLLNKHFVSAWKKRKSAISGRATSTKYSMPSWPTTNGARRTTRSALSKRCSDGAWIETCSQSARA